MNEHVLNNVTRSTAKRNRRDLFIVLLIFKIFEVSEVKMEVKVEVNSLR